MSKFSRFKLITLVLALATAFPVVAKIEDDISMQDGNALLAVCGDVVAFTDRGAPPSERDVVTLAACSSYIRGFMDGVALLSSEPEQGWGYCVSDSISQLQIARVVTKYLRQNPENLHFHPALLLGRALRAGFPCK